MVVIVVIGMVLALWGLWFLVKYFVRKNKMRKKAQDAVKALGKKFDECNAKVKALHAKGYLSAAPALFNIEVFEVRIKVFLREWDLKKPQVVINEVREFEKEIECSTKTLFEDAAAREFVVVALETIEKGCNTVSQLHGEAVKSLELLKKEAPSGVWENFEDLNVVISRGIGDVRNLMENAKSLAGMEKQEFAKAKGYAAQAIIKIDDMKRVSLVVINRGKSWIGAKKTFADSKLSNKKREEFVEKSKENGLVNWITVADLVVAEHGRLSSYEN